MNEQEAAIVRRIFEEYVAGKSPKRIAAGLNAEGVISPYGGTRWAERRREWAEATTGVMLPNERYIGEFVWNKSKWMRTSGKARRRILRPTSEWKRKALPALAIVPRPLWDLARLGSPAVRKWRRTVDAQRQARVTRTCSPACSGVVPAAAA